MKTAAEIEAAISERMSRLEVEHLGRSPERIQTRLIGDLLIVRLRGVLKPSEQRLARSLPDQKGRAILKQVRSQLMEAARPIMEAMVLEITGVKVLSLHHDISTVTGEKVVLFTLASEPLSRKTPKR